MVYKCHYPTMTPQTARGVKTSADPRPAGRRRGAYFRDVSGWEGADWYAPAGHEPKVEKLSWGRENWFPVVGGRASRRARGRDPHGHVVHEQVPGAGPRCRPRAQPHLRQQRRRRRRAASPTRSGSTSAGTLEADLTVTKLDDERFFVVVTDTMHRHAETWMRRHTPERCARVRHRRHLGLLPAQRAGAAVARAAADADQRRSLQRGVSVPHGARDRHRLCARAVHPHHLRRRAGLRALHSEPSRRRTSTTAWSRPASRSACATPA